MLLHKNLTLEALGYGTPCQGLQFIGERYVWTMPFVFPAETGHHFTTPEGYVDLVDLLQN